MTVKRKILITCAAQNAALASIRSLHAAGWRVTAFDYESRAKGLFSRACDEPLVCPHNPTAQPAAYAEWVLERLRSGGFAVLLPVTDAAIFALLPRKEEIEAIAAVPWPSAASVCAAADKTETFRLAAELGLPIPRMHNQERGAALPDDLSYPVVIKPHGSLIEGRKIPVTYADNPAQLAETLAGLPAAAYPVSLQQRITGPGEGYFAVWRHGEPLVECAHRRKREIPPSGGVSTLREAIPVPNDLRDYSRRLLERWGWHGPAMVEFKRDRSGRPYLMEVNGRLWGSLQLAVDAGIDIPLASALVAVGETPPPMTYTPGVRTRWELGDTDAMLTRLLKSERAQHLPQGAPSRWDWIFNYCADFFRSSVRAEVCRRGDRGPFWRECRNWLSDKSQWVVHRVFGIGRSSAGGRSTKRVVLHVHSTISYDGELSVAEIAALMRSHGVSVCCLAEHSRGLTAEKAARLAAECRAHSNSELLLVPGIEYDVQPNNHLLGYGCTAVLDTDDPQKVADAIRRAGGLAVLAHPGPGDLTDNPQLAAAVDGVEVWNTMHDGAYLPNPEVLAQFQIVRRREPGKLALHGNDFHFRGNFHNAGLDLEWGDEELTWPAVVARLRAGRYRMSNRLIHIPAAGVNRPKQLLIAALKLGQWLAGRLKRLVRPHHVMPFWDYLGCRPEDAGPARYERDGGIICWRVVGTFAGVDRRGHCCRQIADCRDCAYYRWRNRDPRSPEPLRVLHLIETGNPGGAEQMMLDLLDHLDPSAYTNHVGLVKTGWLEQRVSQRGVPVTLLPLARKRNWRWIWHTAGLVRRRHYDLLHSHEFTMNTYSFLAGKLAGVPTIHNVHGNLEYIADNPRRKFIYRVMSWFDKPFVVVSQELKERMKNLGVRADSMRVILNGIALRRRDLSPVLIRSGRRALGLQPRDFLIGVIGRLMPVKGQDVLLAALPRLLAEFPKLQLALVGRGDFREELERQAAALGVARAVVFTGHRDDIRDMLACFDMIVIPSRAEGLSLGLIEAMTAARPIVATAVGGNPQALTDGESGLLVPPEDPEALAAAIIRLLRDPDLARTLGENARRRAEERFTITRMVEQYRALYAERTGRR